MPAGTIQALGAGAPVIGAPDGEHDQSREQRGEQQLTEPPLGERTEDSRAQHVHGRTEQTGQHARRQEPAGADRQHECERDHPEHDQTLRQPSRTESEVAE
jgi:hypothetical protein